MKFGEQADHKRDKSWRRHGGAISYLVVEVANERVVRRRRGGSTCRDVIARQTRRTEFAAAGAGRVQKLLTDDTQLRVARVECRESTCSHSGKANKSGYNTGSQRPHRCCTLRITLRILTVWTLPTITPPKKRSASRRGSGTHLLNTWFFGPPGSQTQMASWSVQPFLQPTFRKIINDLKQAHLLTGAAVKFLSKSVGC